MLKSMRLINSTRDLSFDDISTCPICGAKISPKHFACAFHWELKSASVYCECTACGKPFIVYFEGVYPDSSGYCAKNIAYIAPMFPNVKNFEEKIKTLSPNFVETYNQSLSAETYNLHQIAGMGYRKALEFLIKDYCIFKNPDKADNIRSIELAKCIGQYINDEKIKNLSKVSAWLGNDETHYVRKFEDKDISDLKRFIDTTVYFILYHLNADEASDIVVVASK